MVMLGVLVGCGSPSELGTGKGSNNDPGTVALRYNQALFAGDFPAASQYVVPSDRNAFLALTTGLGDSSVTSRDLAIGSVTVNGSTALAILTGTICSTGGTAPLSAPSATSAPQCISNTDSHSINPAFRVTLSRGSDGAWMVFYQAPEPGRGPPSGPSNAGSRSVP